MNIVSDPDFIPRLCPIKLAINFGMQWNKFRQTQLDKLLATSDFCDRFWKATGWGPEDYPRTMGAGRRLRRRSVRGGRLARGRQGHRSGLLKCCRCLLHNLKHPLTCIWYRRHLALPFPKGFFRYVYSLGVLQHTPDPERSFKIFSDRLNPGVRSL